MKLEFFIESIYYDMDNPTPSVFVTLRNNLESLVDTEPIMSRYSKSTMGKIFKNLFRDYVNTHKTIFVIPLAKYRQSGFQVGDRIECDLRINNVGEITQ